MTRLRWWVGGIGLVVVVAIVVAITMWPSPIDRGLEGEISRVLGLLHRRGLPEWFGYRELEFSANIVMFVPLGFFVGMLLPMRAMWIGVLIPPLISATIEGAQLLFLPRRFATLSDILANSLGGWIGVAAAAILVAAVHARDRRLAAQNPVVYERVGGSAPSPRPAPDPSFAADPRVPHSERTP